MSQLLVQQAAEETPRRFLLTQPLRLPQLKFRLSRWNQQRPVPNCLWACNKQQWKCENKVRAYGKFYRIRFPNKSLTADNQSNRGTEQRPKRRNPNPANPAYEKKPNALFCTGTWATGSAAVPWPWLLLGLGESTYFYLWLLYMYNASIHVVLQLYISEISTWRCIGNHSYGMPILDLLPMLYIVGLRGRYISTIIYYILYIIYYILNIIYYMLYVICYILYIKYYILYVICYILYIVY